MKWNDINQLCDVVRETSFAIHMYHRNGHLERIYENALVNRLRKQGLKVEQQFPLTGLKVTWMRYTPGAVPDRRQVIAILRKLSALTPPAASPPPE